MIAYQFSVPNWPQPLLFEPPSQAVPANPAPPPNGALHLGIKQRSTHSPPSVDGRWSEDGDDYGAGEQGGDKFLLKNAEA